MKHHEGPVTDKAVMSVLTHASAMIHVLAPVSKREVQNDCTRHLLRDWAWQAQARGTAVSLWSCLAFSLMMRRQGINSSGVE